MSLPSWGRLKSIKMNEMELRRGYTAVMFQYFIYQQLTYMDIPG